jgi:hypothetical protein
MTSPAFEAWRSSRLVRLDRLIAAHPDSPGSATDPAVAEEWTQALVLRLAGEFQGFCRDLHNYVAEGMVVKVAAPESRLYFALLEGLTVGRGLDQRNADPETVSGDFTRLGVNLRVVLGAGQSQTAAHRDALRLLNRARNGVVHDDPTSRAKVEAEGWPMRLDSVRRWRDVLDEIALAIDDVSSQDVAELFRGSLNKDGG